MTKVNPDIARLNWDIIHTEQYLRPTLIPLSSENRQRAEERLANLKSQKDLIPHVA